jgi:hypothetical protein
VKKALFGVDEHPDVAVSVRIAVPWNAEGGFHEAFKVPGFGEKEPPAPLSDQVILFVPLIIAPPREVKVLP